MCSILFLFVSEIVIVKDLPTVCVLPTVYIKMGAWGGVVVKALRY
jgi:hypothetical protein